MSKSDTKRISFPLPSVSLKQFIERAIKDDDFFERALENPLGSMDECGVNLEKSAFRPDHFATFFGALAGVREAIQQKGKERLNFEQIFGHPAQIRGAVISAEMSQGFCREWDNRDAFAQKMQSLSSAQSFDAEVCGFGPEPSQITAAWEIDGVSTTFESKETWHHTRYDWSTNEFQQSHKGSEAGTSQSFEGQGRYFNVLNGPLIHPTDLAAVAARLQTFSDLVGSAR